MSTRAFLLVVVCLWIAFSVSSTAQIPRTLSYQGVLTDTLGNPKPKGIYAFTMRLYETSTGGSPIWIELKNLSVSRGLFSTILGDQTPFDPSIRFDRQYWLGIQLGMEQELSPRIPLTSVGYSFYALRADTALAAGGGGDVWQVSGNNIYYNNGNVGIGTNTPTWKLHVIETTTGGASVAGFFDNSSTLGGTGVLGVSRHTSSSAGYGVFGNSASTSGRGVYGLADATSGANYGGYFASASSGGKGVYGSAYAGSGTTYGGYFENSSPAGFGVYGIATATSGVNYGVYGKSSAPNSYGVYGYNTGTSGVGWGVLGNSLRGYGVWGVAGSSTATDYGVFGTSPDNVNDYGVYSNGRFAASGTKMFQIDHPLDPANKYLNHYCAEGPEPLLIYRGTVVLDANGEALVELPHYFEAINRDFHYQLTCLGSFAPVYISQKVQGNRFKIAGGRAGLEVSWTVTGARNDAFVRSYGAAVEQEKSQEHHGKYLNPALYGMPGEFAIHRVPEQPAESKSKDNRGLDDM